MNRLILSVGLLCLLAVQPSQAATDKGAATAEKTVTEPASTEQLMAGPPQGWELSYQMNRGSTRITDFVPPGESGIDWITKLTFESNKDLVGSDPSKIIQADVSDAQKNCDFVQEFNVFSGKENKYPTATRLILCGNKKQLQKGEVSMLKAIGGKDYFYIISLVKYVPPFKKGKSGFDHKEVAAWSRYLRTIRLCDTASSDHPCPKPAHH